MQSPNPNLSRRQNPQQAQTTYPNSQNPNLTLPSEPFAEDPNALYVEQQQFIADLDQALLLERDAFEAVLPTKPTRQL